MSNANSASQDFGSAKARLEEIAEAVSDENMPLDDALDLFEEAVALGLKVSDLLEDGIVIEDEQVSGDLGQEANGTLPQEAGVYGTADAAQNGAAEPSAGEVE